MSRRYLVTLVFALGLGFVLGPSVGPAAGAQTPPDGPIHQLRIYEIFEHNKAAFHERFRDHAVRIMRRYDFRIVAMWEAKGERRTEFVYVLEWPDETTMKAQWTKFLTDQEWGAIKEKTRGAHGALVGEIQERVLRLVPYSPVPSRVPAPPGR